MHINSTSSDVFYLDCGVPQGSVLDPKIFITYTEDIDDIFDTHNVQHHSFADNDTQMYVGSIRSQVHTVTSRPSECIADVTDCRSRRLQLNGTNVVRYIILVAPYRHWSPFDKSLAVCDVNLQPVESVRNLGVYFDSELSMKAHVSKTAEVCFFQLRCLRQIRRLLGRDVTSNLVAALVFSRLDYGNALLAGLPHTTLASLQRVIDAAVNALLTVFDRQIT